MSSLSLLFLPRSRKVEFYVDITVHELVNVPLVTGNYYVKWRLQHGEKKSGSSKRAQHSVRDHSVVWNYQFETIVQLVIGRDGYLMPCELKLSIKQELNGGKEVNNVGILTLNLAEYVGCNKLERRYLLQDSKINSNLKLNITMKQKHTGDVAYKVPPLKKAHIFGGITGIISERKELQDDERSILGYRSMSVLAPHRMSRSRSTPSLRSSYLAQESRTSSPAVSRLRDMEDLSAVDVIEEIFMGNAIIDDESSDANTVYSAV
ncbi:7588_t:CDS:2 [Paraglomus occultum]|uniref:7588_t:CDS:1 n=1 Tax=Paraglomus occultum TaxID=144539 RepID=A0A9N9CJ53_9GLOM|nr:7588_t:CDS:2 [Paraglomus occultum]